LVARVAELARLGFNQVVVPATASVEAPEIRLYRARSVGNALLVLNCGVR
jgi:predicted ATP-dependent serine protease